MSNAPNTMTIADLTIWTSQFHAWEQVELRPNEACLKVSRPDEHFYCWPDNGKSEHWKFVGDQWVEQPQ